MERATDCWKDGRPGNLSTPGPPGPSSQNQPWRCLSSCGALLACKHACTGSCGGCLGTWICGQLDLPAAGSPACLNAQRAELQGSELVVKQVQGQPQRRLQLPPNLEGEDVHASCCLLCTRELFCGHECRRQCHQAAGTACPPCLKACPVACSHRYDLQGLGLPLEIHSVAYQHDSWALPYTSLSPHLVAVACPAARSAHLARSLAHGPASTVAHAHCHAAHRAFDFPATIAARSCSNAVAAVQECVARSALPHATASATGTPASWWAQKNCCHASLLAA